MREAPRSDRSPLRLVIPIGCIWLLSSALFLLSASLDLILFSSFAYTHFIFSFKDLLPTSFSAPHVQSCSPPPLSLCSLSSTTSFPSTPHSTSTRFGWAGPLAGHHILSCLSGIFLHQELRQKPHTHCVVALDGKYL